MNLYEHTIIAKQNFSKSELEDIKFKYSKIINENGGEILKTEDWGLIKLSYLIKKNKKGNYIHFKLKGNNMTIFELEKNERIDVNLLRFLTVKVKKFDLNKNYFYEEKEINEKNKNYEKK